MDNDNKLSTYEVAEAIKQIVADNGYIIRAYGECVFVETPDFREQASIETPNE
jgi:hypothetical protein